MNLIIRTRPVSTRILQIDGQTKNLGEAVVYISEYETLFEHRYWTLNALRPTEFLVPGESVSGLDPAQFHVFEERAVSGPSMPGIRRDASLSHVALVKDPGKYPETTKCFAPCPEFPPAS